LSGPAAYLDYNATAPVRPEAAAAVAEALGQPANASSVHAFGRRARSRLELARATVAEAVGAAPESVAFVSGGTEANNLALLGTPGPALVSAVEHPSVLESAPDAPRAPVDAAGRVDLAALERLIREHQPRLVSLMLTNNETGVVQPVAEAARLAHAAGALLHVDAAQALGRIPVALDDLGADLLSLSGHKLGGPPGVGALVLRPGVELTARQRGGAQELRRRAGTENLPAILGMAAAIAATDSAEPARVCGLRDRLESRVLAGCAAARIVGAEVPRLPNTTCLLLPGMEGATQLMALDLAGVAVSTGSACSSGKVGPSHVLLAMGLPEGLARCAIRVSLGWASTEADVERFLAAWLPLAKRTLARTGAATTYDEGI
jgi:cysteine desulfurase